MQIPLGKLDLNSNETLAIPHDLHSYCLGKSGVGKSVYLNTLAEPLIGQGYGLTIIDPHASLIDRILRRIPKYRMEHNRHDVILLRVAEGAMPGINPFAGAGSIDDKVSAILDTFAKTFEGMWYESSDSVMRWACYAVLEQPYVPTFATVKRFLKDDKFMKECLKNVTNQDVLDEFSGYEKTEWKRVRAERIAPVLNKLDKFITNKKVKKILCQERSLDFRRIINDGKIFLVDLSGLGRKEKVILGGLILNMLFIAAQSRKPGTGKHHSILVDEAQTFVSAPFDYILAELRKYNVTMHITTQYVAGFPEVVRDGIFGNCSTEVVFKVGGKDAKLMVEELTMEHPPRKLQDLPNQQAWVRTVRYDSQIKTLVPLGPLQVIMNPPSKLLGDEMNYKTVIKESIKWFCPGEEKTG